MADTDTRTATITALMDGVTDGPWEVWHGQMDDSDKDDPENFGIITASGSFITYAFDTDLGSSGGTHTANARFIAASRQLVPALLAERDAKDATIAELQAKLKEAEARDWWLEIWTDKARARREWRRDTRDGSIRIAKVEMRELT